MGYSSKMNPLRILLINPENIKANTRISELIPIVLLVIFTLRRKVHALVQTPDTGGTLP